MLTDRRHVERGTECVVVSKVLLYDTVHLTDWGQK
jgi:hypothetical protein